MARPIYLNSIQLPSKIPKDPVISLLGWYSVNYFYRLSSSLPVVKSERVYSMKKQMKKRWRIDLSIWPDRSDLNYHSTRWMTTKSISNAAFTATIWNDHFYCPESVLLVALPSSFAILFNFINCQYPWSNDQNLRFANEFPHLHHLKQTDWQDLNC